MIRQFASVIFSSGLSSYLRSGSEKIFFGLTLLSFLLVAKDAQAVTYNFSVISPSNSSPADLANLVLTVNVTDGGAGTVLFDFQNDSSVVSTIAQIYFDDAPQPLLSGGSVQSTTGTVSFFIGTGAPGPNILPGGNNVGFSATSALNAKANNPIPFNGINPTEALVLSYVGIFNDIIAALDNGSLKIGLHVQTIGRADTSDSFVNTSIPEPATATLLLSALAGFGAMRRRRV